MRHRRAAPARRRYGKHVDREATEAAAATDLKQFDVVLAEAGALAVLADETPKAAPSTPSPSGSAA
ncbi:hypothetical protein [Streptomyces sp. WMMC940]|uniref:hypothetical protein n=1 Tax=Streptomyces sp. WMMC940 TaxID=3015153 RepID=UPI0022B6F4E1|nr:hypothetical protein [Streptomyces sp. WMMC940]MCZ7459032.1 hypothetical protein [Streptomyces sp. WMMC940]